MRRNRVTRNRIEAAGGVAAVEEVERWNDGVPDSLVDYGVDISPREEMLQAQTLELLSLEDGG